MDWRALELDSLHSEGQFSYGAVKPKLTCYPTLTFGTTSDDLTHRSLSCFISKASACCPQEGLSLCEKWRTPHSARYKACHPRLGPKCLWACKCAVSSEWGVHMTHYPVHIMCKVCLAITCLTAGISLINSIIRPLADSPTDLIFIFVFLL